jgi:hypothetical protein
MLVTLAQEDLMNDFGLSAFQAQNFQQNNTDQFEKIKAHDEENQKLKIEELKKGGNVLNEQQKKVRPQPQQIPSPSAATTSTTEKEGASRSQRSGLLLVVRLPAILEKTPRLEPQWERRVVLCAKYWQTSQIIIENIKLLAYIIIRVQNHRAVAVTGTPSAGIGMILIRFMTSSSSGLWTSWKSIFRANTARNTFISV